MTYFTDKNGKTVSISMSVWQGSGYGPDWDNDFFEVGGLEQDEAKSDEIGEPVYKVDDVDYCVDYAEDWANGRGDFYYDSETAPEEIDNRNVSVNRID